MYKFVMPRGTGKTYQLIKKSEENNFPILVANLMTKHCIKETAKKCNANIPDPITVYELKNGKCRGMHLKGLLIDELDKVVKNLIYDYCDASVEGYSLSLN